MALLNTTQIADAGVRPTLTISIPMDAVGASQADALRKGPVVSLTKQYVVKRVTANATSAAGSGTATAMPQAIAIDGTTRRDLASAATSVAVAQGSIVALGLYADGVSGQTDQRIYGGDWVHQNLGIAPGEAIAVKFVTAAASNTPVGSVTFELQENPGALASRTNA